MTEPHGLGQMIASGIILWLLSGIILLVRRPAAGLACLGLLLVGSCLIPPFFSTACGCGSLRFQCTNNQKQLSFALLNYEATYNSLPPAYVVGPDGKPWHSWRVLILPYIEEQKLFEQYDFNEPWNGPNNIKLANKMPSLFRCRRDPAQAAQPWNTSYLAIVGPETAWPGAKGMKIEEITDGTDRTLLVVEATESGICWTEPRDMSVAQATGKINSPNGIRSPHDTGANVVFVGAYAHFLVDETTPEVLRAHITAAGGEDVDPYIP